MTRTNIKNAIQLRTRIAFLCAVLGAMALIVRINYIQWVQGPALRMEAQQNQIKQMKVPASRGNIYAIDGQSLLATSLPYYRVAMDPTVVEKAIFDKKIDSLAMLLSRHFKDGSAEDYRMRIRDARREGDRYLFLNRDYINFQDKKKMSQWPIFRLGKTKGGVIFEKIYRRYYPFDKLAKRTIGYLNEDNGGAGLEFSYNSKLAGRTGYSVFQKIAGGNWKPIYDEILPVEGYDIITTLDVNLQDVAEASLEKHLRMHQADHGCVVLMDVHTGEIRALANLTLQKDGSYAESYNHAIKDKTEPGSTFKLASYMALLEEGKIQIDDSVNCENGKHRFYDKMMVDSKEGLGVISVRDAFAKSSNVAVSKLVFKHFGKEPQKYLDYLDRFGLSANLKFQMKGAEQPFIKRLKTKDWSGTTLPWMSVGYEVQMTPIQTLSFYNAVANDGKLITPILVKKIVRADQVLAEYETEVLQEKICADKTLDDVRKMLEAVVDHGTASNIKNPDYRIAGKTGTAQKIINRIYSKQYYTSFVGYFPADKPKYSCIVIIDNPKGYQQYGADVAAPVFKELGDKVYAQDIEMHKQLEDNDGQPAKDFPVIRAGYEPDLTSLCNAFGISNSTKVANDNKWVKARLEGKSVRWYPLSTQAASVPDVRGMRLKDALYLLENRGVKVGYTGKGRVVSQSLPPGAIIDKAGSYIQLELRN